MKNIIFLFLTVFFGVLSFILTGMLNEIVSYIGFGAGFVSIMFFVVFIKKAMPVKKPGDKQGESIAGGEETEKDKDYPADAGKKPGEEGGGKMKKLLGFAVVLLFAAEAAAASKNYIKYGNYYYSKGRYKKAIRYYSAVLKKNPRNLPVMKYCAFAYMKSGYKERAAEYFERIYELTKNKKYLSYARKMRSTGQNEKKGKGDYVWKGGTARVYGMGKPQVCLPDASNANDLYEAGFTAALVSRPRKNVIYAEPGIYNFGVTTESETDIMGFTSTTTTNLSSTGFGLSAAGGPGISSVCWINKDLAVAVKPVVFTQPVSIDYTVSSSLDSTSTNGEGSPGVFSGEAGVMYRVNRDISAGFMLGYDSGSLDYNIPDTGTGFSREENISLSKPLYFLSGMYKTGFMEYDLGFSLGFGVKGGGAPFYFSAFSENPNSFTAMFEESYPLDRYSVNIKSVQEAGGNISETETNISMGGFDIMAGAEVKSGKTEAALKANVIAGMSGTRESETTITDSGGSVIGTTVTDKYGAYKNGGGIEFSSRARRYFGPVILGSAADYRNISIEQYDSADDTAATIITQNLFGLTIGCALDFIDNLLVPVEFFIRNTGMNSSEGDTGSKEETSFWGARAGGEYKLSKDIAVRAGVDYSGGGTTYETDSGSTVTTTPYGTEDNPGLSIIGISAGGGYDFGEVRLNAALRYESTSRSPLSEDINEYSQSEIYFLTGVFIYL